MSYEAQIHQAQTIILRELLFTPSAGFAKLQKPTGLTSDHFKFHIKRLLELDYVEKAGQGLYRLTDKGKEYANKLDTDSNTIERQPKSAVILVIEKVEGGKHYFVAQQRRKHPYFGFWGFPTGKIRWGETIKQTAACELDEETGLQATFKYRGVYHELVIQAEGGKLLEDKIFHVMHGTHVRGELKTDFDGGRNVWQTLAEVRKQENRYLSFDTEAEIGLGKHRFIESTVYYSKDQF